MIGFVILMDDDNEEEEDAFKREPHLSRGLNLIIYRKSSPGAGSLLADGLVAIHKCVALWRYVYGASATETHFKLVVGAGIKLLFRFLSRCDITKDVESHVKPIP